MASLIKLKKHSARRRRVRFMIFAAIEVKLKQQEKEHGF